MKMPVIVHKLSMSCKWPAVALALFTVVLQASNARAQDSWATMSSDAGKSDKSDKSDNGEGGAASVSDNFSGSGSESSSGSGGTGGAGGDNAFGVENENIFGDDPLNNATPSDSPDEVGNSGGAENAGTVNENPGTNSGNTGVNNTGNGSSPAQENSGNFNFNNNSNLNKQSTNGNVTNNTNVPAANGTVSNSPLINATPVSDATTEPTTAPAETPGDQPAPVAATQQDPGYAAPTIPVANDFAGAPPIPGTRRIMADGEAPIEYTVESGDTLYDVCDQLLDEGGYWPKLWSMNPDIKNPHFIYPGMKLRFYPGDNDTVPFLEVVSEDDVVPMDKGPLNEKELIAEDVPIRADREQSAEPPPELIRAEDLQVPQEILDMFMMVGGRYTGTAVRVTIPGFIFEEEKTPEGYVIGGREGRVAVPEGNSVVIEQSGSLSSGTIYTVLRPAGKVETVDGESVGYRYVYVATVKIKQVEDDVAVGVVADSRLGVQSDDILVPYLSTSRTVDSIAKGQASPAQGEVVGFDERGQNLGREGGFVFVSKSGLSEGQYVPVFRGAWAYQKRSEEDAPRDLDPVGQIRIIDASGSAALGIITESLTGIRVGDTLSR